MLPRRVFADCSLRALCLWADFKQAGPVVYGHMDYPARLKQSSRFRPDVL